jgi:hypothetical protein
MVIWITSLWILLDVAFCVYTEIELHPLTSTEWILAGSGVLVAVGALIAAFFDRESHAKEVREFQRLIQTGQAHQSGKMEVLAIFQALSLKGLAGNTRTSDALPVNSISDEQIEKSKNEIEDLRRRPNKEFSRWPLVRAGEIDDFVEALDFLRDKRLCLTSVFQDRDCTMFVETLANAFKIAGATLVDTGSAFTDFRTDVKDGIQIHSSKASGIFAYDLEQALAECLPQAWCECHIHPCGCCGEDGTSAKLPPDDLLIVNVGHRWPSRMPEPSHEQN